MVLIAAAILIYASSEVFLNSLTGGGAPEDEEVSFVFSFRVWMI